jgi:hypothetical protein
MTKKIVDGVVVDMTAVELAQKKADDDSLSDRLSERVRNLRNILLAETDYLALSDNTLSSDMSTYRQALRDITSQAGFPTDVTWPTKPTE